MKKEIERLEIDKEEAIKRFKNWEEAIKQLASEKKAELKAISYSIQELYLEQKNIFEAFFEIAKLQEADKKEEVDDERDIFNEELEIRIRKCEEILKEKQR